MWAMAGDVLLVSICRLRRLRGRFLECPGRMGRRKILDELGEFWMIK